jgi:transitional endoplasmic reticulum ATPase
MSQLESLRQALAVSPDNIPLLLLFGEACLENYQPDEAAAAFQKILAQDSSHPEARLGFIKAIHQSGKTSEAIVRLEALIAEQPSNASALLLLSRYLMAEGLRDQARQHYEKSLKLPGGRQDPSLEQELYMQTGKDRNEQAKGRVTEQGWEVTDSGTPAQSAPPSDIIEKPDITFDDVGGMENVKEEVRMKILYPLKNPGLFKAYGKRAGGGVLLYGPPGCGKTLISRATAGEIDAHFISIGIHQILDLYIGESEKNLHQLFELARDNAPSILFFDEVDALAADRRDMRKSASRTLINQFLAEMDGNVAENDGVLILGATNAPWHIDPAFKRPGRFDRVLFVPPPDAAARASIIEVLSRGKPAVDLNAQELAAKTKDFSGADLKAVFDIAVEKSLAQAMRTGQVVPIRQRDLLDAAKTLKPSTKAWFESAKNYALYSNQGGFYDDVLAFLGIKK